MSKKNFNKESIQKRIPKNDWHDILHNLMMQQIKAKQTGVPLQSFSNGRRRYFFFTYKSFNVVNRLKDTALSLIKRQFIKKPRNPE